MFRIDNNKIFLYWLCRLIFSLQLRPLFGL